MCDEYVEEEEPEPQGDLTDAVLSLTNEIHGFRYEVCKLLNILEQFAHKMDEG